MSKDPAFLFYSSDFLTGTLLMSMEQKGKFITLLCIQHQKGHMSERDMLQICGTYDEDIFDKFQKDSDGKFFNERLKEEIENTIKEKKVVQFKKPSFEEVKAYMSELKMNDLSEQWFNHYEAIGWMIGKNKMKDWKASVRTWKANQKNNTTNQQIIHRTKFNLRDYEL